VNETRTLEDGSEFSGIICQPAVPLIAVEALDASQAC